MKGIYSNSSTGSFAHDLRYWYKILLRQWISKKLKVNLLYDLPLKNVKIHNEI